MKTKLTQSMLVLFLVVGVYVMGAGRAEALSSSIPWNSGNMGNVLFYFWNLGGNGGGGWARGLSDWNVTIHYNAQVQNNGLPLNGNTVAVGDSIAFGFIPHQDTDISWFGSGYSLDSPFGHWLSAAAAPATAWGDFVNRVILVPPSFFVFDIYIPFSVNPPTITYDHVGSTAGLSCDGTGQICTVTSPGSIIGHVNFSSTYGKFYYMYQTVATGAWAYNQIAMKEGFGVCGAVSCTGGLDSSSYTLTIPAQTITFNLTAISNNNNPTVPTVTPQPFNGNTSTAYPFTFMATDPDGDQIAYEVDWDNDGVADQSTGYVSSGTPQSLSNPATQWTTAGTYSFKVRTKDNQGGVSAWATPSVTLVTTVTGVCGLASGFSFDTLLSADPALCTTGTPGSFLSTGTGWTWGCNGSGGGTSTAPNACSATIKTYTLTAVKNLGLGAAGTIIDTTPTTTSIDSTVPRNSESVPYNSSRTLRANPNSSSVSWIGCTSVSGNDCTIANITSAKTVAATFTRLAEPGVCGSANGQSFETLTAASSGICASGAITGFSLSGTTYSWNCNGSFGSAVNVSCSANQLRHYDWTEASP